MSDLHEVLIQIENSFTGEVLQYYFAGGYTARTLTEKLNRIYFFHQDFGYDVLTCPPRLPSQKIVIGKVRHLLPVFLKYSPIIVSPTDEGSGENYALFLSKRKMKLFSLKSGVFMDIDMLDADRPYEIFSCNAELGGFTEEASAIFDATRREWEGKLRLAYTNRNTIREDTAPDKPLKATDTEVRIETAIRLRLMGFHFSYDRYDKRIFDNDVADCLAGKRKPIHPALCVGRNIDDWEQERKQIKEDIMSTYKGAWEWLL